MKHRHFTKIQVCILVNVILAVILVNVSGFNYLRLFFDQYRNKNIYYKFINNKVYVSVIFIVIWLPYTNTFLATCNFTFIFT